METAKRPDNKTILIIDDHPLFREGLKSIIRRDVRFKVVGEAGDAREGIGIARRLRPDLALIDISLPDQSGIDLTREIRKALPNTRVMIVSMHCKINYVIEAFKAGAMGYMVKDSASERLLQGIEDVIAGGYYLDASVASQVMKRVVEMPTIESMPSGVSEGSLTPREQEVMRLLAMGLSNKEISEKLFISPKTVENHRSNIMHKLGLHSYIEFVRYAAKLGLVNMDT
jgi:DNA-binding NarL/FixJ family response regulator